MRGTNMNSEFPTRNNATDSTTSALNKSTEALNEFAKALNNLTKTINGSSSAGQKQETSKETQANEDSGENSNKPSWFKTKVVAGFTVIKDVIKSSFRALGDMLNSLADTVGGAIGSVFGSGLIGNMIAKGVTKGITGTIGLITGGFKKIMKGVFSMGKMIVSGLISNLPQVAFYTAIIAALGGVAVLIRELWGSIKWLGYAIDQAFEGLKEIFTFGAYDNKYEVAYQNLSKKLEEKGIPTDILAEMYPDTIRGRNQYYEDWKSIEEGNTKVLNDILEKAKAIDAERAKNYEKNKIYYQNIEPVKTDPKLKALQDKTEKLVSETSIMGGIPNVNLEYPELSSGNVGLGGIQNAPVNIAVEHNNSVLNNNLDLQVLSADNPQIYSTTQGFGSSQSVMR